MQEAKELRTFLTCIQMYLCSCEDDCISLLHMHLNWRKTELTRQGSPSSFHLHAQYVGHCYWIGVILAISYKMAYKSPVSMVKVCTAVQGSCVYGNLRPDFSLYHLGLNFDNWLRSVRVTRDSTNESELLMECHFPIMQKRIPQKGLIYVAQSLFLLSWHQAVFSAFQTQWSSN